MKTNLIFKRNETINGVTQVVTKIVPVEIPHINRGEGWMLSGHADIIEIIQDNPFENKSADNIPVASEQLQIDDSSYMTPLAAQMTETMNKEVKTKDVTKFDSNVLGTAKLVRSKGVIKIVARRGKTTYNQTTPNSVCINDFTKNEFFKNCREVHGNSGIFEFRISDGRPYDYWNDVIDKEYNRQKRNHQTATYIE